MRFIVWWPMAVVLCVATFTDLRSRRIPNWLVLPFMASGIAVSSYAHGMRGLGDSLAGLGLGAIVYGILYCLGGMGLGDVKLCAAIGAWIGPGQLMISIVITALVGGVMAICWAAIGGFLGDLFRGSGDLVFGLRKRGFHSHPKLVLSNPATRKMPYAPAIAIGTFISFFSR